MRDFDTILEIMDVGRTDEVLHRKYAHFGWQVIGLKNAKERGRLYFGTLSGTCQNQHNAPYLVNGRVCAKCFIIAKRRTFKMKHKVDEMSKDEIRAFWRKQLNLPEPAADCKKANYIYIVENFPYTSIKEAANFNNTKVNVIRYRCESDEYPDFVSIPTSIKT